MKLTLQILESKKLAIFITIIIFILCTIPSEELPNAQNFNDKTAHFVAFGAWAICWFFSYKNALRTIILGCLFGVFIEVWQYLLPESFHRGFEVLDMVADAIGVFIGVGIGFYLRKIVN